MIFKDKPEYAARSKPYAGINWGNDIAFRSAEILSAGVLASARGLAKLGAYMANRGSFEGREIMHEKSWEEFHANSQ